jgi:hypothetical protein
MKLFHEFLFLKKKSMSILIECRKKNGGLLRLSSPFLSMAEEQFHLDPLATAGGPVLYFMFIYIFSW